MAHVGDGLGALHPMSGEAAFEIDMTVATATLPEQAHAEATLMRDFTAGGAGFIGGNLEAARVVVS